MNREGKQKLLKRLIRSHGSKFHTNKELYEYLAIEYRKTTGVLWSTDAIRKFVSKYGLLDEVYTAEEEVVLQSKLQLDNARLKAENSKVSKLLRSLTAEAITDQDVLAAINSCITKLPLINEVPLVIPEHAEGNEEEVILLLSDHHITRNVDFEEMEGYNVYNFDVWADRYFFLINEVIKIVDRMRSSMTIRNLNVYLLGDMFNDTHRLENIATNILEPIPGTINGSYVLAQGIAMLSQHFEEVRMVGIVGNEPRLSKKTTSKLKFNNYDYLGYNLMALLLSDYIESGKLTFNIPPSPEVVVDLLGYKILLTHGDTVRGWNGIPYYGINRQKAKQQSLRRSRGGFDYWFMAHFHTPTELEGTTYVNGALCGVDEYAKNILHVSSDPIQKLFGFNEKYGISYMYNLNCKEAHDNDFTYTYLNPSGNIAAPITL